MACKRFISSIGNTLKGDLKETFINSACFVSVLSDGSTDSGVVEQEVVYVRYLDSGIPKTHFAGINPPEKADAKGLLGSIETVIKSLKPQDRKHLNEDSYLNEIYKKLVNSNFDGANVMSGKDNGVHRKMREKQKGLVYTHCVAHQIELAVLDSIKDIRTCETLTME